MEIGVERRVVKDRADQRPDLVLRLHVDPTEALEVPRAWLAAEKGVPESLPVQDVKTRGTAERLLGAAVYGAVKTVLSEWLGVDGPMPLWQVR